MLCQNVDAILLFGYDTDQIIVVGPCHPVMVIFFILKIDMIFTHPCLFMTGHQNRMPCFVKKLKQIVLVENSLKKPLFESLHCIVNGLKEP